MSAADKVDSVTFTTKGQIVIPRKLRKLFEIEEGTRATVENTPDGILIKPVTAALIRRGRGILKKGGRPLADEWADHKKGELELEDK